MGSERLHTSIYDETVVILVDISLALFFRYFFVEIVGSLTKFLDFGTHATGSLWFWCVAAHDFPIFF